MTMSPAMRRCLLPALALQLALLTACATSASKSIAGKVTADGELVVYEWVSGGKPQCKTIADGHAMMIFKDEAGAAPRFVLYSYPGKSEFATSDLDEFRRRLALIPEDEKVRYYNTCGPGTHQGLDPGVMRTLESDYSSRWIEYVFCVCE